MDTSGRMKRKALICMVGILVLVALALSVLIAGIRRLMQKEPVVEQFVNVWITEVSDTTLRFYDGIQREYEFTKEMATQADRSFREQLADVTVTDGQVSGVAVKKEQKITGKVLFQEPKVSLHLRRRIR